jgi:hypothetical protein
MVGICIGVFIVSVIVANIIYLRAIKDYDDFDDL